MTPNKPKRIVIEPHNRFSLRLQELWEFRELFYFFTWRDVKVKYKQTYLGIAWAVLQPLLLMILFTLVFARHFASASSELDYKVFVLSGLVLWTLFYNATSHAADSIVQQAHIIRKIYFPRFIIVGSAVLTALFDFAVAFLLFLLVCLFLRQPLRWEALLFFPAGILLTVLAAFGMGTLLAALNVKFRDFRYALPFLLQLLFFSSQVVYPLSGIESERTRRLLWLNPVNAAIELFRAGLTGRLDAGLVATGLCVTALVCLAGFVYFRKTEAYFADLV